VFDAELHAVHEATSSLLTTISPCVEAFICIDNKAAIDTLSFNKSNHEYARRTLANIEQLRLLGWSIRTVWGPSHCDIPGNDRADTLAKQGVAGHTPCQYATTTKTWLLNQARSQLLRRWKAELPLSAPSFKFPDHLRNTEWKDTRALWRVFSNRSPSDPHPNQDDDPCPCGNDTSSSHHLLRDCTLLATQRAKLLAYTVGDIQNSDFITCDTGTSGQRWSDGNIELVRFLDSHEGDGARAVFAGVQLLYKNNFPNDPPSKFAHR